MCKPLRCREEGVYVVEIRTQSIRAGESDVSNYQFSIAQILPVMVSAT
jgi:hypothetical protein